MSVATLWICTNPITAEKYSTQYRGRIGSSVQGDYEFYDCCQRKIHPDQIVEDGEYYAIPVISGEPITTAILIAVITAAVTYALLPEPEKPNQQGAQKSSSNNQASGQTNVARLGQGHPDIRGRVRSYPDLVQQAWYTYVGGRRYVRERFMITRGETVVTDVKDNDALIDDISGANYTARTGAVQPDDVYPYRIYQLDDNRLLAPNNLSVQDLRMVALRYDEWDVQIPVGNYVILSNVFRIFSDFNLYDNNADFAELLNLYEASQVTISGMPGGNATYQIDRSRSIVKDTFLTYLSGSEEQFRDAIWIPVLGAPFTDQVYRAYSPATPGTVSAGDGTGTGWTDWATIDKPEELSSLHDLHLNFKFPQGLVTDSGGGRIVELEIETRDADGIVDPTLTFGDTFDTTAALSILGQTRSTYGATSSGQIFIPANTGKPQIRLRRTDNDDTSSVSETAIETIYQMINYKSGQMGENYQLLDVEVKSDFVNIAQSSRKINCIATKKQLTPAAVVDGSFARDTQRENLLFDSSILEDMALTYGEDLAAIQRHCNLDDLQEIRDSIGNSYSINLFGDLLEFNYTFDDEDVSLGQRIYTACNPARVVAYQDGRQWRFSRKEAKLPSAIFNRRNIAASSELKQTFSFRKPLDHDSVDVKYTDPVTGKEAHVYRRINTGAQLVFTSETNGASELLGNYFIDGNRFNPRYYSDGQSGINCDLYATDYQGNGGLEYLATTTIAPASGSGSRLLSLGFGVADGSAFVADYNANQYQNIVAYAAGTGTISEEGKGSRMLEVDLVGCSNDRQATDRAELELRELIYSNRTATVDVLSDGDLVGLGDRVKVANIFDGATVDAEILSVDSATIATLSEDVALPDGEDYYAHITTSDGDVIGPFRVLSGSGQSVEIDPFQLDGTTYDFSSAYAADYEVSQTGSRIIIGPAESDNYYDWFVTGKQNGDRDGTVTLELRAYDARVFEIS
tara:strand:- start:19444 stop:22350 length:2907 start_codon:yes stop_codon:yes gene_type:complete